MEIFKQTKDLSFTEESFSILIPTWNNLPYLQLLIESLRKNSFYKHQFILHINDGSDGTLAWAKKQEDIEYTHSKENIGICYALNAARSLIKTQYLCYFNDDMYACPNWDKALLDEINIIGHQQFFLSATLIEPINTGNKCVCVGDYGTDLASFKETELLNTYENIQKPDWSGATWPPNVVHINTWDIVEGYSVEFSPGMYSDPDFSMKLWQAGARIFKGVGKSKVYHFGTKSTTRIKKNNGYKTFLSKWGYTASDFYKYYLKMGDLFANNNDFVPQIPLKRRIKNTLKRLF